MAEVDFAAPNWKVRRRIYEDGALTATQFPGTPRGYFPAQQLMCAQGVADVTQLTGDWEFGPVDGVCLSATTLTVRNQAANKRRTYDIVPA